MPVETPSPASPTQTSQAQKAAPAARAETSPQKPSSGPAETKAEIAEETGTQLAALKADIEKETQEFVDRVKEGKSDFAEEHVLQNTILPGLKKFLETQKKEAPTKYLQAWRKAAYEFMLAEIASYAGLTWGKMGTEEAKNALDILQDPSKTGKSGKKGIGSFETWIQTSPHAEKYLEWKAVQAKREEEEKQKKATAETAQKSLGGKWTSVEQRWNAVSELAPQTMIAEGSAIKEKIQKFSGGDTAALDTEITAFEAKVKTFEDIKAAAEVLPEEKKKSLIEALKNGNKKPEDAKTELENLKKAQEEALQAEAEEDQPFIERFRNWKNKKHGWFGTFLVSIGLGEALEKLANSLAHRAAEYATDANNPTIGSWVRRNIISNETLLAMNPQDRETKQRVDAEKRLVKFGLKPKLARELVNTFQNDASTILARLKKPDTFTTNVEQQKKLTDLAAKLESKGASGASNMTLAAFLESHPDIQ